MKKINNFRTAVYAILLGGMILSMTACSSTKRMYPSKIDAKAAIIQVMNRQEEAWSAGDIDAFMEGYWKSENLTFIGSKGLSYGWEQTLANYKKGYPSKEIMGKLTFDILSIEQLAPDSYYMIGKFYLERKPKDASGHFTLVWKYIDGKWVIVSDHTS